MDIHENRARAESFGTVAADYDTFRPRYPEALVTVAIESARRKEESAQTRSSSPCMTGDLGSADGSAPDVVKDYSPNAGLRVLDVGAGTGILAAQLDIAGAEVFAVEPDPDMAKIAEAKGLNVEVSTFENWEPAGRTFDLVTFGQSFHWVDPAIALPKIRDILEPSGSLALAWNDIEATGELRNLLGSIAQRFHHNTTSASLGTLETAGDGRTTEAAEAEAGTVSEAATEAESDPGEEHPVLSDLRANAFAATELRFKEPLRYSRDAWLSMVFTYSAQLTMDPDQRDAMYAEMQASIPESGLEASNEALLIIAHPTGKHP